MAETAVNSITKGEHSAQIDIQVTGEGLVQERTEETGDDNEIDLGDNEDEDNDNDNSNSNSNSNNDGDDHEIATKKEQGTAKETTEAGINDSDTVPPSEGIASSLKDRLRLLKQKMNQSRQLNRQAVQEEGQKVQHQHQQQQSSVRNHHNKPTKAEKLDPLTQQAASQVIYEARQAAEKEALNQFSVHDYHNPQGQFRNYQRNVASLPSYQQQYKKTWAASAGNSSMASLTDTTTFDPTAIVVLGPEEEAAAVAERDGARRLAHEMHRRIDKQQKRERKRKEKELAQEEAQGDVSYINQRNKHYNKKINREFDEATAEIRQNLERGTAL